MTGAAVCVVLAVTAALAQAPAEADNAGTRHLIFFAENRPIFVRLQVTTQGRPFDLAWVDSVKALHACLDRNGDEKLTANEADPARVGALVRLALGATAEVPALPELDVDPKDGNVSIDELAEALRPILGPFQLQLARQAIGRTDALFDQLDRDKDGALTRPELAAIAGSLRPLDLNDDAMISPDELEPLVSPALAAVMGESSGQSAAITGVPPVVEIVADESTFRPARFLLKKYDKGKGDVPGRPDNRLSPSELAIDPEAFARADSSGDDALDTDELRKWLAHPPVDIALDVALSFDPGRHATFRVSDGGDRPKGTQIRQPADSEVQFAIGHVGLDFHVDDSSATAELAGRAAGQQFKAADVNKNGYLEGKELAAFSGAGSPFAGLTEVIDRDGDGKLYLKELILFTDRQVEAARFRLVMATADHARAIFGILDLDRDRRLGAREVMRTVDRVMSWDADGDSRVSADEIPYHFQVDIVRGGLPGLIGESGAGPTRRSISGNRAGDGAAGPVWFQKMDRNHDGDVSRREFLGPRDQFDRLDRDDDGLIDADEARAASSPKS